MHIIFDARMVHYRRAGIGQYAVELLNALAAPGLLPLGARLSILQMRQQSSPIVAARGFRRIAAWTPPHNRFEQYSLPLELLRVRPRPSVIHCPDFVPPRLRPCPAVVNIQDLAFLKFPHLTLLTGESRRYYGQVRWAAHNAEALIALSHSARDDIVQLLGVPAGKIAVIPAAASSRFTPATDFAQARALAHRRLGLGADSGGYILFVGTIEPRKNLSTLIEAYSLLKAGGRVKPLPGLLLIGAKGWLSEGVEARVDDLGLSEHVTFLRGVDDADLPLFYRGARLFAMPSLYEGFGLPVLEALACAAPVISSNAGSLSEVAGDAALLLDPLGPEAWAGAMERVLLDDDLASRLRAAGPTQAARFSWYRAASDTAALYQNVVGESWLAQMRKEEA